MYVVGTVYTVAVVLSAGELIRGVAAARRTRTSPFRAEDRSAHGVFVRGTLEAAFLSGGPARAADALIAGMHEDGGLVVAGPGVVGITRPNPRNAAEQAVVDAHTAAPNGALHWLRAGVMRSAPVQETGDALARRGLVVRPGLQHRWHRRATILTFLTLTGFMLAALLTTAQYGGVDHSGTGSESLSDGILMLVPAGVFGLMTGLICGHITTRRLTVAGRSALYEYVRSSRHVTGAAHLVAVHGLSAAHPDLREQLMAAARIRGTATPATGPHPAPYQPPVTGSPSSNSNSGTPVWCGSGSGGGGGSCSGGGGSCSGGGGGSACSGGGGGSACSGGGSSCSGGGGSSCSGGGGGSSCSGGGGSSCSSSSSSF
ncbi:TIGR04222 domain-containing membrane protein [Streptomyces sp. NPDC059002]|uniref:TIGR04222 domain-containing membrane protein n=1 Tax=Streptomyces sp. NPDC059002 TaxID=3346690 RepID=UPI00367A906F